MWTRLNVEMKISCARAWSGWVRSGGEPVRRGVGETQGAGGVQGAWERSRRRSSGVATCSTGALLHSASGRSPVGHPREGTGKGRGR